MIKKVDSDFVDADIKYPKDIYSDLIAISSAVK